MCSFLFLHDMLTLPSTEILPLLSCLCLHSAVLSFGASGKKRICGCCVWIRAGIRVRIRVRDGVRVSNRVRRRVDKMSSQMLYRYILRRTQIVSTAKRHKQRQLTSRKTRSNTYIQCIYIYSKQSR